MRSGNPTAGPEGELRMSEARGMRRERIVRGTSSSTPESDCTKNKSKTENCKC